MHAPNPALLTYMQCVQLTEFNIVDRKRAFMSLAIGNAHIDKRLYL